MAKVIEVEVGFCPACGQLKGVGIMPAAGGAQLVTVYCACGAAAPQTVQIMAGDTYKLDVATKTGEAESDDDTDSGDVPES